MYVQELIRSVAGKHVELADSLEVSLLLALDPRIPELLVGNDTGLRIAINRFHFSLILSVFECK